MKYVIFLTFLTLSKGVGVQGAKAPRNPQAPPLHCPWKINYILIMSSLIPEGRNERSTLCIIKYQTYLASNKR